jgi:UDP-2-acetamido-3-amino-2,3-dideoxy-glucuronate N-acetyltransferase
VTGRVRVAVVGVGRWGKNLARVFAEAPRARLAGLCDTDPTRLSDGQHWLPPDIEKTVLVDELLDSADVDAVVIATPPETHAPLARRALNANKHVFVEKPMALSSVDAQELRKLAQDRGRRFMVGHVLLYHPAVAELSTRLRMGELGEVNAIHCVRVTASRKQHREAAWWSLAPHDVSLLLRLLGAHPREITASRCETEGGELIAAELVFPGGSTATIQVGVEQSSDLRRLLVVGTKRAALFDDRAPREKLKFFRPTDDPSGSDPRSAVRVPYYAPELPNHEPLAVEARHFIDAILDGRAITSDALEGCAVVSVLEAGGTSLAQGGVPVAVEARNPLRHRHLLGATVSVSARSRS